MGYTDGVSLSLAALV